MGIVLHNSIHDRFGTALCQSLYGDFAINSGIPDKSFELYSESICVLHEFGNPPAILANLSGFAHIASYQNETERLATIYGILDKPVWILGYLFLQENDSMVESIFKPVKQTSGKENWNYKVRKGRTLSITEAVRYFVG